MRTLLSASVVLRALVRRGPVDAKPTRSQTFLVDETERHETIARVVDRLADRFPDAPRALITRVVADEYNVLDAGRIRTYIPTLVEHGARNRLHREFTTRSTET